MFTSFLVCVGFYALCCYLYDNLRSPVLMLYSAVTNRKSLKQQFGNWAAVTGSTDGIGKAYARELARQGLNVVLISRSESKLRTVAADIENKFGVQTKIVVADFTNGQEVYDHIEKETADIPIAILVNNVGMLTAELGHLSAFSAAELWQLINTNMGAVTQMSRLFLRRMQRAHIRGAIVNISSCTAMQPVPLGAVYAASKSYTTSLTQALQQEARPHGITVQLVTPNFVGTKINYYSKFVMRGGLLATHPESYARFAVYSLGKTDETTGYCVHGIQAALWKIFAARIKSFIIANFLDSLLSSDIRTS